MSISVRSQISTNVPRTMEVVPCKRSASTQPELPTVNAKLDTLDQPAQVDKTGRFRCCELIMIIIIIIIIIIIRNLHGAIMPLGG